MAIVRNSYCGTSRLENDFSPGTASRDEANECSASLESVFDGGFFDDGESDADSGMGSDEFDFSELGEPEAELCQVENQSFSFPLELYDLPSLGSVLSLETWNECLTEEERFALAKYLPDMDQENFEVTLKELFSSSNFQFGSPLVVFFSQLKGGLCDPRVVLYRRGLNFFQWHQYYHNLCKYQNSMVGRIVQMRDAWKSCAGNGIKERLRLLNTLRSRRSLGYDRNGDLNSEKDTASSDSADDYWSVRSGIRRGALCSTKKASFNSLSHKSRTTTENPVWSAKEKAKGILKVAAQNISTKKENVREPGFDSTAVQGRGAEGMAWQGDRNADLRTTADKSGSLKSKRKDFLKRYELYEPDLLSDFGEEDPARMSSYLGRSKNPDQAVTIASSNYNAFHKMKKPKQAERDRKYPTNERLQNQVANIPQVDWSDANRPYLQAKVYEEASSPYHPGTFHDSSIIGRKWKTKDDFRTRKSSPGFDFKYSSYKAPAAQRNVSHFHSEYRKTNLLGKLRSKSSHHEGVGMEYSRHTPIYAQSEETQSDSSDQVEEGRDMYPYASKSVYPSAAMEVPPSGIDKPGDEVKLPSRLTKSNKKNSDPPDGSINGQTPEMEAYTQKVKKKVKMNEGKSTRRGPETHFIEKLQPALCGSSASDRKQKGMFDLHHSLQQANDICNHGRGIQEEAEESLDVDTRLEDMESQLNRSGNKSLIFTNYTLQNEQSERSRIPILGCNSLPKKLKGKGGEEYIDELGEPVQQLSSPKKQNEDSSAMRKKGKRKADAVVVASSTPEPIIPAKGASELEMDMKAHKKPFTLITPTIHTGFSFSVMHLLSSVRKALITAQVEDAEDIGNHLRKEDTSMVSGKGEQKRFLHMHSGVSLSHSPGRSILEHDGRSNLPSLTVQEIVDRVRSNPGDPCILETPEPLQDLVRGVLKIFSSKTAPLGAKGWNALALYDKSSKSWFWVGPVPSSSSDIDNSEEENSAEAWSIPHKMLVKLVDAFANWLKSGQETLQQIGSLPTPPAMLPVMDYKDRFRDLRAQKSLNTISPSSEEVRAYFHKEELLRYSIPDRAFQYTAVDGRKSIVAPLRRGGGKPTSKARDHFMLKTNRPPHVTILCLVRDAAARLPGSIGTRADVCTLIRDSQYIVEDVTDAQVNQVVSGALDRLHYERDPCVQFDGDRKLWVYLHRDREEEDFEDDGTSSTKKWKRQRKEATDNSEMPAMNNDSNYLTTGETAAVGYDFNPDISFVSEEFKPNNNVHNIQSHHESGGQSNSIRWGVTGISQLQETKMICQENSTNQEFDDEAFSRERPVGIFSAGLF